MPGIHSRVLMANSLGPPQQMSFSVLLQAKVELGIVLPPGIVCNLAIDRYHYSKLGLRQRLVNVCKQTYLIIMPKLSRHTGKSRPRHHFPYSWLTSLPLFMAHTTPLIHGSHHSPYSWITPLLLFMAHITPLIHGSHHSPYSWLTPLPLFMAHTTPLIHGSHHSPYSWLTPLPVFMAHITPLIHGSHHSPYSWLTPLPVFMAHT